MTTYHHLDDPAINDAPLEWVALDDGTFGYRRAEAVETCYTSKLGGDLVSCVKPRPRPCGWPFPACDVPAELVDTPLIGTGIPTDPGSDDDDETDHVAGWGGGWGYGGLAAPYGYGYGGPYVDLTKVLFAPRFLDAEWSGFWSTEINHTEIRHVDHHPAPVPLPAAGLLLIAALVGLLIVWR